MSSEVKYTFKLKTAPDWIQQLYTEGYREYKCTVQWVLGLDNKASIIIITVFYKYDIAGQILYI